MSGCASSAFRAVTGSRVTAVSAVRRSYAATCWTRPSSSGASGDCGSGRGAAGADPARELDDVVVRETRHCARVSHVDHLSVPGVARERRDQRGSRLAVEGAAALLEERWLLRQLRIAIQLEQLALDLGNRDRARGADAQLLEHLVVPVEVTEVRRRNRTELVEQAAWELEPVGDLLPVLGEQPRQHVFAVDDDSPDPREVVEPHLVDEHTARLEPEPAGEPALKADRHVAEPHCPVAGVEQRARDDADRVREVDDPRVRRRIGSRALRDLEHDGDGAQRLGEASGAGGLLPDAAAAQRRGLVAEARLLPADPDLQQHEVSALDGTVEIVGHRQPAAVALLLQHARRHGADDLAALAIDVVQHELAHRKPLALARDARDELRRVGRPGADDRDLHPFTPVSVTPSTNACCARKKISDDGQHDQQRRRHGQVPLHLVQVAELREPDRRDPVVGVLAHVQERQEEVVPRVEHREERHRGDGGLRQSHDDRRQDAELAAAVDARGVEVLLGDREEELAQQEDGERVAEPVRDDQRPQRADEVVPRMQLRPHHVERHDRYLRRQHQRDEHDEEDRVPPSPAQPREGVGDRDARDAAGRVWPGSRR